MTSRKKPGVAFWATVVVVVALLYVASFGPACWITSHLDRGSNLIPVVYRPIAWAMSAERNTVVNRVSKWYAKVGAPENWEWQAEVEFGIATEGGVTIRHIGWKWDCPRQPLLRLAGHPSS